MILVLLPILSGLFCLWFGMFTAFARLPQYFLIRGWCLFRLCRMVILLSSIDWDSQDWKAIHYHVRKIQKRIADAAKVKDWHKVRELQKLVFASYDCRVLAVHRVTCRQSIRTPGLDGRFWHSDSDKYAAVDSLKNLKGYVPQPFKRFLVPKDHDKTRTRPLSVPVIYDRAVQSLILIAVDPVVEVVADSHAYGFRRCRSAQDAIKDVVDSFGFDRENVWFLRTDVKECFDHLSHEWLLQNAPIDKKLLHKILTCGYVFHDEFFPTVEGMPQGGVLSPVMTTLALSGFEKIVSRDFPGVHIVRFVDDFIFSGKSPEILNSVLDSFRAFLSSRGLSVSDAKTRIAHIAVGFDFIGWHFSRDSLGLCIRPSNQSVDELKVRMLSVIHHAGRWTCKRLILKLNDIITGWGQYHAYLCNVEPFAALDDWLQNELWQWALLRHPKHSAKWVYLHYWRQCDNRRVFSSGDVLLLRFSEITIRVSKTLDLSKNPYIDVGYFRCREKERYCYTAKKRI